MNHLNEQQHEVVERVLDHESSLREHVVVALSGAHAYGFPSPDSDLDLKGMHIAPTESFLGLGGLEGGEQTADRLEVIDGVEVDYTSNELGGVLNGILRGNGNYLERVLGPIILRSSALHEELVALCRRSICKRVHHHYRGFASSQHKRVLGDATPAAKRVLYVLRTSLTGTHLLRTGELVVDVRELLDLYGFAHARDLIAQKRAGEKVALTSADKERWLADLERALRGLDEAYDASDLPAEAPTRAEAESWLVRARVARLDRR